MLSSVVRCVPCCDGSCAATSAIECSLYGGALAVLDAHYDVANYLSVSAALVTEDETGTIYSGWLYTRLSDYLKIGYWYVKQLNR